MGSLRCYAAPLTSSILALQMVNASVTMLDSRARVVSDRFGTYRQRLRHALWIRQGVTGEELTQQRIAELVGAEAKTSFRQTTAGGWLKGKMPRDLETQLAIARVLSVRPVFVDPGWLYYGPAHSKAPAPIVPEDLRGTEATSRDPAPHIPIEDEEIPLPVSQPQKRVAEAGQRYPASAPSPRSTPRGKRRPKR